MSLPAEAHPKAAPPSVEEISPKQTDAKQTEAAHSRLFLHKPRRKEATAGKALTQRLQRRAQSFATAPSRNFAHLRSLRERPLYLLIRR